MKAKILSIVLVIGAAFFTNGCKKDPVNSKIGLELVSVNGTDFNRNQVIEFRFRFTPAAAKEDTLFVRRRFFTCPFNTQATDSTAFAFPDYVNNGKADLRYTFIYATSGTGGSGSIPSGGGAFDGCFNPNNAVRRTDSATYTFWVKDKNGNISDTVVSPRIILRNN